MCVPLLQLATRIHSSLLNNSILYRKSSFKEDDGTWRGNEDGKVVNNQPQRVMDDRNGVIQTAGYVGR